MPKTLLLADDSVTIQKVVGISFANEDVKLVTVDNGDDALARARQLRPDIVLADVVMPGMNGYELCEAIKADAELSHIPVLLLTGTFEAFDSERASRAGADGHITKPFEAQALVDQVNRRLAAVRPPAPKAPTEPPVAPPEKPRAATQRPVAPPPSAAAQADDGFEFFEEETTAPSGVVPPAPSNTTTVLLDDGLGLEGERPDAAFAFDAPDDVHRELSVKTAPAGTAPEPQPTVQRMDPRAAMQSDLDDDLFGDSDAFASAETAPPVDTSMPRSPTRPSDDATRVVISGDPMPAAASAAADRTTSILPGDLDDGAVLDPSGVRDYDVSSSDLGDLLGGEPEERPARAFAEPDAPFVREPLDLGDSAFDLGEPLAVVTGEATATGLEPIAAALPEPEPAPAAARRAAGSPALDAVLRQQVHDSLEKIAWEAFGDVAERIVKEALARVEQVAWEVIPQMTEALIQEELRRLKEE